MCNYERLRNLLVYLGIGETAAAVRFGITRGELRLILGGAATPSAEVRQRVEILSRSAPEYYIAAGSWPSSIPDPDVREMQRICDAAAEPKASGPDVPTVRPGKPKGRR